MIWLRDDPIVDPYRPGIRLEESCQQVEDRRLATPGRTQEGDELTIRDLQIQMVKSLYVAIGPGEALNRYVSDITIPFSSITVNANAFCDGSSRQPVETHENDSGYDHCDDANGSCLF